jgi:hypothetical protein
MKAFLIEFKLYFLLAAAGVLLGGIVWLGAHERSIGAARVQAKWDKEIASQAQKAAAASEDARKTEGQQVHDFAGIETGYLKATTHEYPSIADALPAAVTAGTVQLRHACPPPDRGSLPEATARSRAADASATQALADRTSAAITAVRIGDAADARERQLRAQVIALQAINRAERAQR